MKNRFIRSLLILPVLIMTGCGGDAFWNNRKYWAVVLDSPGQMNTCLDRNPSTEYHRKDFSGNWADLAVEKRSVRVLRALFLRGVYPNPVRTGKTGENMFDLLMTDQPPEDEDFLRGLVHYRDSGFVVGAFKSKGSPLVEIFLGRGYRKSAEFILLNGGRLDPDDLRARITAGTGITDTVLAAVLRYHYSGTPVFGRDFEPDPPFLDACLEAGFTETGTLLLTEFTDYSVYNIPWDMVAPGADEAFFLTLLREDRKDVSALRDVVLDGKPLPLFLIDRKAWKALLLYSEYFPGVRNESFGDLPLFSLYYQAVIENGDLPDSRVGRMLYSENWEKRVNGAYRKSLLEIFPYIALWDIRDRLLPLLEKDLDQDGEIRGKLKSVSSSDALALTLSPDGRFAVVERGNGFLELRDARNGEILYRFTGVSGDIPSGIMTDTGGEWFAHIGSVEGKSRLIIRSWVHPRYPVYQSLPGMETPGIAAGSPDSGRILVTGESGKLCYWDTDAGEILWTAESLPEAAPIQIIVPDSRRGLILTSDRRIQRLDMKTGSLMGDPVPLPFRIDRIAVSADGRYLAAGCVDAESGPLLILMDSHTLEITDRKVLYPGGGALSAVTLTALDFNRSGTRLLAGHSGCFTGTPPAFEPGGLVLFGVNEGKFVERFMSFKPADTGVNDARFSPDGRLIYCANGRGPQYSAGGGYTGETDGIPGEERPVSCHSSAFGDTFWVGD